MAKSKYILPVVLVGGAAAFFYYNSASNFAKVYQAQFNKIAFNWDETKKSLFTRIYFDVSLGIVNPTNFEGTLNSMNVELFLNSKKVGTLVKTIPTKLNKQTTTLIPFKLAVSTLLLYSNVLTLTNAIASGGEILFEAKGTAITDSGAVKIDLNNKFKF